MVSLKDVLRKNLQAITVQTSVTLTEENYKFIKEEEINLSKLTNLAIEELRRNKEKTEY